MENEPDRSMQDEYALIGFILGDSSIMNHIGFLSESHFSCTTHSRIFEAMRRLHDAGEPISPFTVQLSKDDVEVFADAGGLLKYLTSTLGYGRSILYPVEHAKHLVRLAQKRQYIQTCRASADKASLPDDGKTAEEHAAVLCVELEKIMKSSGMKDFENDYEISNQIYEDLSDIRPPCSTGLEKLDIAMGGGLFPGRSYGFAARKKVGKTVLASTISCNLNTAAIKHLFICGEMSPKEIHQRNLARLINRFPSAFRTAEGQTKDFKMAIAQEMQRSNRCILYHNAPGLTFDELKRVASSAIFRHNIKGLILDYWQLVGGKAKNQSTSEHLDEVAQWIADFGRKNGIWTITMAQINQEGNTRGGEGIRLAFDQVYKIRGMGEQEDISFGDRWVEMMDTRYTEWQNIGDESHPGLIMEPRGPYFVQR